MAARVPTARMDMEVAAVRLFAERGADNVTVDEIASAANVTARTFHRHFPHKLDVLFGDEDHQFAVFAEQVRRQPPAALPWEALCAAVEATAHDFDARSELIRARAAVVQADPALRLREQARVAEFVAMIVQALADRGLTGPAASALAYGAIGVFRASYEAWLAADGCSTFEVLARTTACSLGDLITERGPRATARPQSQPSMSSRSTSASSKA